MGFIELLKMFVEFVITYLAIEIAITIMMFGIIVFIIKRWFP
jgi:hypothetical protein